MIQKIHKAASAQKFGSRGFSTVEKWRLRTGRPDIRFVCDLNQSIKNGDFSYNKVEPFLRRIMYKHPNNPFARGIELMIKISEGKTKLKNWFSPRPTAGIKAVG